jgi:hypothetical protein
VSTNVPHRSRSATYSDESILLALLETNSIVAAAAKIGCDEKTIRRRLSDSESPLLDKLRLQRYEQSEFALALAQSSMGEVVALFRSTMNNRRNDLKTRLYAAKELYRMAVSAIELFDVKVPQHED